MEIAELAVAWRDRGRGRLRHRRRRGGLPAHPAPRRVRVPPARERPLHHPRRRGVRAAVDLAGDPVVRRRPARPRRADHRRHHRRPTTGRSSSAGWRRTSATSGSRWRCARPPTCRPAPPTSIAEHPIGLLDQAAVPGHGQHRQPADERHLDDREMRALVEAFGYDLDDLRWFTINAMKSAFLPFDERLGDHRRGRSSPGTPRSARRAVLSGRSVRPSAEPGPASSGRGQRVTPRGRSW